MSTVHFLVLEDDRGVSRLISRLLAAYGCVHAAFSCEDASETLARLGLISGLVVDVSLPDGDGLTWLECVRSHTDVDAPAAIVTGHHLDAELALRCASLGRFVAKPTAPEQMPLFRCALEFFVEEARQYTRDVEGPLPRLRAISKNSLTETEIRVAELGLLGLSRREIAERLGVTEATVRTHVTHALAKCGLKGQGIRGLARAVRA